MNQRFKYYLPEIENKHLGSRCFIVGSGSSLYNRDISYINKDDIVILVNAGCLLFFENQDRNRKNTYWVSNDATVMGWEWWDELLKFNWIKIIRDSWRPFRNRIPGDVDNDILWFDTRKREDIIEYNDNGLVGVSSVPTALDLSMKMGCKKIYLLGVDHYITYDGKSYFHDFWEENKQPKRKNDDFKTPISVQKRTFQENISVFNALKQRSLEIGADINNISDISRLVCFNKINLI